MQIQSSTRTRYGFENRIVTKVSDAVAGDTVFFENQAEMDEKVPQMHKVFADNGLDLEVVVGQAKETKNGSIRTFIGEANYERPTTSME